MSVVNGRLCANIPGGTSNPWDAIVGQNISVLTRGGSAEKFKRRSLARLNKPKRNMNLVASLTESAKLSSPRGNSSR